MKKTMTKWDRDTSMGSPYYNLRVSLGMSHEEAVKKIEGRA